MCLGSKRYVSAGSAVGEERLVFRRINFDGESVHIFRAKSKFKIHI